MNTKSPVAVKIKNIDKSKAEISFHLFPQNVNEEGFLHRFSTEEVVVAPSWMDRSGKVFAEEQAGAVLGAKFQVVIAKKQEVKPTKATRKASE
jgi:hypothetical protein